MTDLLGTFRLGADPPAFGFQVGELEARLAAEYEVDPAELGRDLRLFLSDLVDRGLVVLDEEDSQAIP